MDKKIFFQFLLLLKPKHFLPNIVFNLQVENMIKKLRYAMKKLISGNAWMDETTKNVAREKVIVIL